ncbi:MAG: amino acid racemase [Bacillota bacterium]|nr:amino acid racemase [Bacillota bacterium]
MIKNEKIIGIIGGMGPMATVDLFNKIILNTNANSDQEHAHIIIDNNTMIPDRSKAINENGQSPVFEISKTALKLIDAGANILIMPCNTAHYFYKEIKEKIDESYMNIDYTFINMIEETAKVIDSNGYKKVYLLATTGTYKSRVYQNTFKKYGINVVVPNFENQEMIMKSIYNYKKGINNYHKEEFIKLINDAQKDENIKFVLGCTELPIIFRKMGLLKDTIDPTEILAKVAIKEMEK